MKRVTSRAWLTMSGISVLLIAGIAVPHAAGNDPSAEDDRRRGTELSVTPGRSESARISRPSDRGGASTLTTRDVTLSSYDADAGRAVLSQKAGVRGTGGIDVRKGDVIASPPTKAAPAGALVKVRDVRSSADGGKTEIGTSRASLSEVFGGANADGKIPVPASAWKVDPLVKGLDVARGAAKDSSGRNLHVDFDTELPELGDKPGSPGSPGSPEPGTEVGGYLDISPKVDFSYDGNGSADPADATASISVGGGYKAGWRIKGTVAEPHFARRLPLAEITAHPVIMVGPVPVVVTVKLTLVLKVQADGRIQMDVRQDASGTVRVGARYAEASGWESDTHADGTTRPGGRAEVSGQGELRTMLGPEGNVSLYDTVGVDAFFGPYLRATAEDSQQGGEVPGTQVRGRGTWKLYGGLTLESSLYAQLPFAIIGNRPSKRIHFPTITREWPIADGRIPALP